MEKIGTLGVGYLSEVFLSETLPLGVSRRAKKKDEVHTPTLRISASRRISACKKEGRSPHSHPPNLCSPANLSVQKNRRSLFTPSKNTL